MFREIGRIRVRLLIVNLVVLVVPIFGLEFARLYERQLLGALERDMRDQCAIVRESLEGDLEDGRPLDSPAHERMLVGAARSTRTRIRVLNEVGFVLVDSHRAGPPEGPEPPAPTILPDSVYRGSRSAERERGSITPDWVRSSAPGEVWPAIEQRREVRSALGGHPDAFTRVRERTPGVFLFVTEPVRSRGAVVGVVYATRSTRPVLAELYKIRTGLIRVLIVAIALTLVLTLVLAWSISRPLSRLARAARRIAGGERVKVPVGGGGEIRELGEAFATMTEKLDARMSYIRDFAADVAHELKSPLTSIRGAAELLREGAADDPDARKRFLTNIELDAERLDRLVTRLLELSRIDSSQARMEPFDVGAMIARVVERTNTPETPVLVEWQTPLRRFSGREEDIERALTNLVENALRFSPEGAPVRVGVTATHDGRELRIVVRDQGPGVPAAIKHKIFDRFFTTDADRNGTGLGLAIVESVAQAHGGRVELASKEGEGAAFMLVLRREER